MVSQNGVAGGSAQKDNFVLTGLAASTTYWVDIQAVDSSTDQWTYSYPVLAVMNTPTPTNSLPNVAMSSNINSCTDTTATTLKEAGFGVGYTIPSSAEGNLRLTLTFEVTIPATSGANTQWELVWGDGASPACNTPGFGITPGNTYTVTSQSGTYAGGLSQSESFVLPDIQKVAGTTIWVDVIAYDSSGASWTFSNPTLTASMFPD